MSVNCRFLSTLYKCGKEEKLLIFVFLSIFKVSSQRKPVSVCPTGRQEKQSKANFLLQTLTVLSGEKL